jgi:hypothetical protein
MGLRGAVACCRLSVAGWEVRSSRVEVRGSRFEVRGSRIDEASGGLDEWELRRMRALDLAAGSF